jgi:(E)-4-hydroxy-3-methylbut-2-enyl-diphosphate synthase
LPEYEKKYGKNEFSLVESALFNASILEKNGVSDIVLSVKASSADLTVKAYRLLHERCDYPLHIGVTEAGTVQMATVKSAVALGSLLLDGIGDTMRVSITDDPVSEIIVAKRILRACGIDNDYVNVISCPTCGRCMWDSMALASKVSDYVEKYSKPLKVAVMGCVVNGPGEAREADIGIAGGNGEGLLFARGKVIRKISESNIVDELFDEIRKLI